MNNAELKIKSQTIQFIIGKITIINRQYGTRISSGWYSGKWLPVDDICMRVSECVAWVTGSGQIMSSCVTISQLHQHLAGVSSPLLYMSTRSSSAHICTAVTLLRTMTTRFCLFKFALTLHFCNVPMHNLRVMCYS